MSKSDTNNNSLVAVEATSKNTSIEMESNLVFKDSKELFAILQYQFKDLNLFQVSMTHRSLQTEGSRMDYERLEFLGDAVLDLAIAQLLLEVHPDAKEGELSKMRAALVNTQTLADVARNLSLGSFVRLSRAEIVSGGSERDSTLADVFEALIGAIYKESGFELALRVIERVFLERLKSVHPNDPKTELQECLHQIGAEPPQYLLEFVEGPEHAPTFISVVKVSGELLGKGSGRTKKASQQGAAAEALKNIENDSELKSKILKMAGSLNEDPKQAPSKLKGAEL